MPCPSARRAGQKRQWIYLTDARVNQYRLLSFSGLYFCVNYGLFALHTRKVAAVFCCYLQSFIQCNLALARFAPLAKANTMCTTSAMPTRNEILPVDVENIFIKRSPNTASVGSA